HPAVPVVTENAGDAVPHFGDLVPWYPGTQPYRQLRVRCQATTDQQVETRPLLGMDHTLERDIVDFGLHVPCGRAGDRGFVLPGQVRERGITDVALGDLGHRRAAVDDLVGFHTGHRRAEYDPWAVPTRFGGVQTDLFEPSPDLGNVLDPDPVQLDVLSVGDIGGVPRERVRDLADHS